MKKICKSLYRDLESHDQFKRSLDVCENFYKIISERESNSVIFDPAVVTQTRTSGFAEAEGGFFGNK